VQLGVGVVVVVVVVDVLVDVLVDVSVDVSLPLVVLSLPPLLAAPAPSPSS